MNIINSILVFIYGVLITYAYCIDYMYADRATKSPGSWNQVPYAPAAAAVDAQNIKVAINNKQ